MRRIIFYIIVIFIFSCKSNEYINEECVGNKKINKTNQLKLGDILPSFTIYTSKGSRIFLNDLNKDGVFIFFKTEKNPKGGGINDEILNEELKKVANNNNIDLLVGLDLKIAKIYGADIKDNKIEKSILFIANNGKVIQKIYENVCEDEIIEILNELKTSPNNGYN